MATLASGEAAATPSGGATIGWGWPSHPFPFFVFFLKKKKKFIYLFFNKFIFFIKMNTCRHLIGLTWHLTESVKKFNGI
jgi:hypothetical protein